MDPFERLIPLAVLAGVGTLVVLLLRRSAREAVIAAPRPQAALSLTAPQPVKSTEAITMKAEPEASATVTPPAAPKPSSHDAASRSRTPIDAVLGLLRRKDALPAAFLLREILGPPVSRRI